MTDGTPTPDIDRRPIAFVSADPADARRIAAGSAVLVRTALPVGAAVSRVVPARWQRTIESRWARTTARHLRIDLRVEGMDNIDPATAYVVMPLHESFVDIPVLLHVPLPMRFIVREELLGFPWMGRYVAATNQIVVAESPATDDLLRLQAEVRSTLESGESVVVFPQASVLGIEAAFQRGTAWLARTLGAPILPVVISGTHRVWGFPFDTTVRLDQAVTLRVLDPVPPATVTNSSMRALERHMKSLALDSETPPRRFVPERDGWWDGYRFTIDPDFAELAAAVAERRSSRGM